MAAANSISILPKEPRVGTLAANTFAINLALANLDSQQILADLNRHFTS